MRNNLNDLAVFAAIAEERSFTRAAQRLGVSQSAVSHSLRGLEKKLGIELVARTSRSVAPTVAGEVMLRTIAPALAQIERSLSDVQRHTTRPSGRLRLIVPQVALSTMLMQKLAKLTNEYPDIVLDITTSNDPVDIVAAGYAAGIQAGEYIQRDMIAVRVSDDLRFAVFGSPAYFEQRAIPRTPRDLKNHACIAFRFSSEVYRWEFQKGRRSLTVNPQGPLVFDESELVVKAALQGTGIGMALETSVAEFMADGRLVPVLKDWCQPFPGFYLYYPSRRNKPAALSALIRTLRLST